MKCFLYKLLVYVIIYSCLLKWNCLDGKRSYHYFYIFDSNQFIFDNSFFQIYFPPRNISFHQHIMYDIPYALALPLHAKCVTIWATPFLVSRFSHTLQVWDISFCSVHPHIRHPHEESCRLCIYGGKYPIEACWYDLIRWDCHTQYYFGEAVAKWIVTEPHACLILHPGRCWFAFATTTDFQVIAEWPMTTHMRPWRPLINPNSRGTLQNESRISGYLAFISLGSLCSTVNVIKSSINCNQGSLRLYKKTVIFTFSQEYHILFYAFLVISVPMHPEQSNIYQGVYRPGLHREHG